MGCCFVSPQPRALRAVGYQDAFMSSTRATGEPKNDVSVASCELGFCLGLCRDIVARVAEGQNPVWGRPSTF